jgi:transcription initiation factor TFIIF subunit alpha
VKKTQKCAPSIAGVKRNGTPDLSESGSERKKTKKSQTPGSAASSSACQYLSFNQWDESSISLTPPVVPQGSKKRKAAGEAGSGDETSGEMSDNNGTKRQRVKITSGGRALSPSTRGTGSRQGSPVPNAVPSTVSRVGSPNVPAANTGASSPGGPVLASMRSRDIIHEKPS